MRQYQENSLPKQLKLILEKNITKLDPFVIFKFLYKNNLSKEESLDQMFGSFSPKYLQSLANGLNDMLLTEKHGQADKLVLDFLKTLLNKKDFNKFHNEIDNLLSETSGDLSRFFIESVNGFFNSQNYFFNSQREQKIDNLFSNRKITQQEFIELILIFQPLRLKLTEVDSFYSDINSISRRFHGISLRDLLRHFGFNAKDDSGRIDLRNLDLTALSGSNKAYISNTLLDPSLSFEAPENEKPENTKRETLIQEIVDVIKENPLAFMDFSELNLDGCNLSYVNLSGSKFDRTSMSYANLSNATLRGIDASRGNNTFSASYTIVANSSNFSSADFRYSGNLFVNLDHCILDGADFRRSNLLQQHSKLENVSVANMHYALSYNDDDSEILNSCYAEKFLFSDGIDSVIGICDRMKKLIHQEEQKMAIELNSLPQPEESGIKENSYRYIVGAYICKYFSKVKLPPYMMEELAEQSVFVGFRQLKKARWPYKIDGWKFHINVNKEDYKKARKTIIDYLLNKQDDISSFKFIDSARNAIDTKQFTIYTYFNVETNTFDVSPAEFKTIFDEIQKLLTEASVKPAKKPDSDVQLADNPFVSMRNDRDQFGNYVAAKNVGNNSNPGKYPNRFAGLMEQSHVQSENTRGQLLSGSNTLLGRQSSQQNLGQNINDYSSDEEPENLNFG